MATLNKMTGFKVYKGTKDSFISSGNATTYADAIVFITGGQDASKSCIFAQGTYFANFTEFIAAYVKAMIYVKGVTVGEDTYNAVAGGGYIGFNSADPTTVALDVQNGKITVGLTESFVNKVKNTAEALGTNTDAANASGSAFARIAALAKAISDLSGKESGSISDQITAAINALRTEIVGTLDETDAKTLAAINDELDTLAANFGAITINGKHIVADGAPQAIVLDATDIKVGGDSSLSAATVEATLVDHAGKIKTNTDAIATLNGNDAVEGSVDKKIKDAINEFSQRVTDNNVVDTFKELIDYAAENGSDFSELVGKVDKNTKDIATLNGSETEAGSVAKTVKDAIDAEIARANSAYATTAQGEKADSALQTVNGSTYVDVTAKTDNAQAVSVKVQKVAEASETAKGLAEASDVKSYVDGVVGNYYTKTETYSKDEVYTKAEVDAMWMWEEI